MVCSGLAQAGQPLLTFTPVHSTSVNVALTTTQKVYYRVVNNSNSRHTLMAANLPRGITELSTGQGICKLPFTLAGGASCLLGFAVQGSTIANGTVLRPEVCQTTPNGTPSPYLCYQSTAANATTFNVLPYNAPTLSVSQDFLALSVDDTTSNANLTGNSRYVDITNGSSDVDITGFTISFSQDLPSGTTYSTTNCGSPLVAGGTCRITIIPGSISSAAPGSAENPTWVKVSGSNSNEIVFGTEVFTYGDLYQGSYIYSVNDDLTDYPASGSIGGSGLWTGVSQSPRNEWSVQPYVNIPAIVPGSTSPCLAITDGLCNSQQILAVYPSEFSSIAGACLGMTSEGFSDWYQPAVCQLGFNTGATGDIGCGTQTTPTIQNISSSLRFNSAFPQNLLSGDMSCSNNSQNYTYFLANGYLSPVPKNQPYSYGACVRDFTNPTIG